MNLKSVARFLFYFPWTSINRINYYFHNVKIGKKHETEGLIYIRNKGMILMGDNIRINSSGNANPIGCGTKTYFQVLPGGKIVIGNNVRMSNCAITSGKLVQIGDNVRIGAGVKIYDTDFHSLVPSERLSSPEGAAKSKEIHIGDNAFIGAGSYILKGVRIGEAAVVGAGSVVTKCVPAYEIWAGNPARKVGTIDK